MNRLLMTLFVSGCSAVGQVAAAAVLSLPGAVAPAGRIAPLLPDTDPVYHVQRATAAPVIDGRADEWAGVPAIVLDQKPAQGVWNGPADLSGTLRVLWDDQALYFCATVRDDVHCAPNADKSWWENDAIQFVFDAYRNGPAGGYDPDEHSYLVGDSPRGPVVVSYRRPGPEFEKEMLVPELTARTAVQADGVRVFEWAMPWSGLAPVSPWLLGQCGFACTINDNDGRGFKGALTWANGIVWGQDASRFGRLVFDDARPTRALMLPLRPESRITGQETNSQWLAIAGAAPWDRARVVVSSPEAGPAAVRIAVCRVGETKPVAAGEQRAHLAAGEPLVFSWDVAGLPSGQYDLTYTVTQPRLGTSLPLRFHVAKLDQLRARADELRRQFGVDRPWDDLAGAPALIRRHRGAVAGLLQLLAGETWSTNVAAAETQRLTTLGWLASMLEDLDRGRDFLGRQRGSCWSAYYCAADGSGQWFVLNLPPRFNPRQTYPLVVNLHGAGGVPVPGGTPSTEAANHIEVAPWGRGVNGYRGWGELDVLAVIEYLKQWYRIDPARVSVMGASMGGSGSWRIATRHPDLFAAAAPICGAGDEVPLENLRNIPVLNQHGGKDWTVPIDLSRYAVAALLDLGYRVLHKEVPEAGHSITGLYPARDWLLSHRRVDRPATITYSCPSPDRPFGRAYWLAIREFVSPHAPARADAAVSGSGPQQSLSLGLANAAVLELDVAAMPVDRRAGLLVQVGNEFIERTGPLPDRLFVVRTGDRWTVADQWAPAATDRRPYRAGAAALLYTGEPLLIVYGTKGNPDRVGVLRDAAQKLTGFPGANWRDMPAGRAPVKPDREVTAEDLQRYNLVVIGSRADSDLAARILAGLPLEVTAANELKAGGRSPVSLAGAGLRLASYNPLAPRRLVFVVGTDEDTPEARGWLGNVRASLSGCGEDAWGDVPDLVVEAFDGADRCRMQFTHGWQWRELAGAAQRAPAAAATVNGFARAYLRAIRQASGADFAMTWGDPKDPPEYDPHWFTAADLAVAGAPLETLVASLTGAEILAVAEKWAAKTEALIEPAPVAGQLDPQRVYRVVMPPHFCWRLCKREQNLPDARPGPRVSAADLWREVLRAP